MWPLGPSSHMPPRCSHAKAVHRAHASLAFRRLFATFLVAEFTAKMCLLHPEDLPPQSSHWFSSNTFSSVRVTEPVLQAVTLPPNTPAGWTFFTVVSVPSACTQNKTRDIDLFLGFGLWWFGYDADLMSVCLMYKVNKVTVSTVLTFCLPQSYVIPSRKEA